MNITYHFVTKHQIQSNETEAEASQTGFE